MPSFSGPAGRLLTPVVVGSQRPALLEEKSGVRLMVKKYQPALTSLLLRSGGRLRYDTIPYITNATQWSEAVIMNILMSSVARL